MDNNAIFITGANGEMGHSLIKGLNDNGISNIVALDLENPRNSFNIMEFIQGSILDSKLLSKINEKFFLYYF